MPWWGCHGHLAPWSDARLTPLPAPLPALLLAPQGRMKGLAFALSPTGYWIEVINGEVEGFTLAQTMIR